MLYCPIALRLKLTHNVRKWMAETAPLVRNLDMERHSSCASNSDFDNTFNDRS